MIILHLEAETLADLYAQAVKVLGLNAMPPTQGVEAPPEAEKPEPAPETAPAKKRAHRAVKPKEEPVQPNGADEDAYKEMVGDANATAKVLADEALKAEVIATLQDLFTAGKVKVIRNVLDKYGNGAKSFPEIDASRFPQIRDALARGEIA